MTKINGLNFDAQELREKILDLAMRGKLVKQDPSDEPASELLEKIKAEKAQLVKEKKIKKTKPLAPITDEEKPFDIPDSWEWVRLGDIGEIISGGTPKTSNKEYWEDGNIPWITPAVMSSQANNMIFDNPDIKCINENGLSNSSAHLIPKDSLVVSSRAPIGYINIVPYDYTTNQGCKSVVPFEKGSSKYLYFALKFSVPDMEKRASGTTFKEISGTKFGQTVVPLPPLEEQSRIAAKIAQLFALLRKVESSNDDYVELQQMLHDKVLDLAMRGKLVEQDPSDEPASELLEKIKDEKAQLVKEKKIKKTKPLPPITDEEKPFDIPDSWEWVRISEIFELKAGKSIKAKDIFLKQDDGHPYPCFGGNGIRGYVADYNHDGNYALIGRQGALCGNINLATDKFYATEHAVVVTPFIHMNFYWIGEFLKGLNLNQYSTSVAQPGLAVNKINNVLIPLPPLNEQRRIVSKLKQLNSL